MKRQNHQPFLLSWLSACMITTALVGAGCGRSEVEREARDVGEVTAPVPVVRSESATETVVVANPPEATAPAASTANPGNMQATRQEESHLAQTRMSPSADAPPAASLANPAGENPGNMQATRQEGENIIYTQMFPPGRSALLRVEQQMPAEVRAGQPFEYTIQVANLTQFPVHQVKLREAAAGAIDIIDVIEEGREQPGMDPSMVTRGQMQPRRGQNTDQERIYVRMQDDQSASPSQESPTNSQTQPNSQGGQSGQGAQGQQPSPGQSQEQAGGSQQNAQAQNTGQQQPAGSNISSRQRLSQGGNQADASRQLLRAQPSGSMAQMGESSGSLSDTNGLTLGTIAAGETRTLRVTAAPREVGEAKTCLLVDFQPSLCAQVKVVKPELVFHRVILNQQGQPVEQAYACDPLIILYHVANQGSGKTEPVVIRETLPEWINAAQGGNRIELTVGELEAGQSVEKQVPLQASQSGQFTSRAEATTGNLRAQSLQSSVRILQPQLEVTLDGPGQDYLNRAIRYTVTVSNTSDDPASNTVVTLQVPEGANRLTFASQQVENEGNQFRLGTLEPGENKNFIIAFEASQPGKLTTRATAQAYCAKAQTAELTTQVQGVPAVRLEVVDLKDPVPVGEETTYAIRVKNQGTAKDLNIQLQAQLPQELQFVSAQGDSDVQAGQGALKFTPIKELPPGAIAEWQLKAKANQTNKVLFQVQMSTDSIAQNVTETESTTLY